MLLLARGSEIDETPCVCVNIFEDAGLSSNGADEMDVRPSGVLGLSLEAVFVVKPFDEEGDARLWTGESSAARSDDSAAKG